MIEKLRRLNELGVTAATIAKGIGCGRSTISNWINGNRNLNAENEERLREWLEKFKAEVADL